MTGSDRQDPRDRLEEYADGLLDEREQRELEQRLESDPGLRDELARVRAFGDLLDGLEVDRILYEVRGAQRRGRIVRIAAALTAVAAALVLWISLRPDPAVPSGGELEPYLAEWRDFGERLGWMAAERRAGRVPRRGLGDLEVPPARASGRVFQAALGELDVALPADRAETIRNTVSAHFVALRGLDGGVSSQFRRTAASLATFRRLRDLAGREVADAFYDVFRPGLADLRTARRVQPGSLPTILHRLDPQTSARYLREYREAIRLLERRYGAGKVTHVLARLAPDDRRTYWRDASQDGVGRDAVLAIRSRMYEAAALAGVEHLYVEVG